MKELITLFLRHIPQSNQDALHYEGICQRTLTSVETQTLYGFALALQLLGVVDFEGERIRASSQTAKYTLNSLAEYMDSDLSLVNDWKTRGMYESPLHNGATFLKHLEEQRKLLQQDAPPSREEKVAQVLIKRNNPHTGEPELLFQYDRNARQYQLIGGRYSPRDNNDLKQTIIREIEEELATNALKYSVDYQLETVISDMTLEPSISGTFGALTLYHFSIFHMTQLKKPLTLEPTDRWLSVAFVLGQKTSEESIAFSATHIFQEISQRVGGLENLANSFIDS
jgi:8-oxo-dGTP pyrophosphatase MutT (NUDIX family)